MAVKKQAPASDFAEIRDWLTQISAAQKRDRDWLKEAEANYDRYENEKQKNQNTNMDTAPSEGAYNLLYSNTAILQPALYSSTPKADVRRRYRDADELGKLAATAVERALDYSIDPGPEYSFDDETSDAVFDMLICGRGTSRVRYKPTIETKTLTNSEGQNVEYKAVTDETTQSETVEWNKWVILGNAKRWSDVKAIAFEHRMTKDELIERFGAELANTVKMDELSDDDKDKLPPDTDIEKLKTALVWEIWDKNKKRALFLSPSQKERYLKAVPDPLKLKGFWPMPRPMYFVHTTRSLVPIPLTRLYSRQLRELDQVSVRISKITDAMRVRGAYAGAIPELQTIVAGDDNEFVPIENAAQVLSEGGFDKAIWVWPIDKLPGVLQQLYIARDQIKQAIYEIIGISDILRGATKASETLGAQKIKAQSGSLRISQVQREVQRFVRDILRLKSEVMISRYSEDTWAAMTNLPLLTTQAKQAAQQILGAAQMTGQPADPAALEKSKQPSWGDVLALLKDDNLSCYRIDIETDSTISDQLDRDMQGLTEVLTAVGQTMQGAVPAVQAGIFPKEAVLEIVLSIVRRARLGSAVEDAIEMAKDMPPPPPPGAPPGMAPGGPPQPGAQPGPPPAGPPAAIPGGMNGQPGAGP